VSLLAQTILPAVRRAMSSRSESARQARPYLATRGHRAGSDAGCGAQAFVATLAEIVQTFPKQFADMNKLIGDDAETNFFSNIVHIQAHRRVRALQRLRERVVAGDLQIPNMLNFFLPLCTHFVYECERETQNNMVDAAIAAIAAIAGCLPWRHYYATLNRCVCWTRV
jgi:hypothetical protein